MVNDDDTGHHPWCVEHDPTGTCLSDVRHLPRAGAAWLEGDATVKIVISLGRPSRGALSELGQNEAREVAALLEELADEMDLRGQSPSQT